MRYEFDDSLNRVLLHEFRSIKINEDVDSYAKYISSRLNKLISLGACGFGVIDNGEFEKVINKLNPALQSRIQLIDKRNACQERIFHFFEPLCEEYNVRIENIGTIIFKDELNHDFKSAISSSVFNLYKFFLGIDYKLQIDIDFAHFLKSIYYLHNKLQNDSRLEKLNIKLSSLVSILDSYKLENLSCPIINPHAKNELIDLFNELVSEENYKIVSRSSMGVGYFAHSVQSFQDFKNKIKRYISKSIPKRYVENTTLTLGINLVLAKIDLKSNILNVDKYLPPIVSLK